jgi:hypothetical protein
VIASEPYSTLTDVEIDGNLSGAQLALDGVSINDIADPVAFKSTLIHSINLPMNLSTDLPTYSGTGIDNDGLWYSTTSENLTGELNITMIGSKGGDRNMLCIYHVPPGVAGPQRIYELNNDAIKFCVVAPHTNVMERGFRVRVSFSGTVADQQITNLGAKYLTNASTLVNFAPGHRYGFILINRGWDIVPQFTGNLQDMSWESIRNHCRFSQSSLNCYDDFPASIDITDQSHFSVRAVTIGGRKVDLFSVEDLPHKLTGNPGWDRSDKDFNDVVFAVEITESI